MHTERTGGGQRHTGVPAVEIEHVADPQGAAAIARAFDLLLGAAKRASADQPANGVTSPLPPTGP